MDFFLSMYNLSKNESNKALFYVVTASGKIDLFFPTRFNFQVPLIYLVLNCFTSISLNHFLFLCCDDSYVEGDKLGGNFKYNR